MIIEAQFRQIVKERLAELEWSRADLARALGQPRQVVTNILNDEDHCPGAKVMEAFFEALGIQPVLTYKKSEKLPQKIAV